MTKSTSAALACGVLAILAACGGGGAGGTPQEGATGPRLTLSATQVKFGATRRGVIPAAQVVVAANAGGGTLAAPTATVAAGGGWLDVTVEPAAGGYAIALQPAAADFAPATYVTSVEVASPGAAGSPASIVVSWEPQAASTADTSTAAAGLAAVLEANLARYGDCYRAPSRALDWMRAESVEISRNVAAVAAGRLAYVRDQADACIAWIEAATCPALDAKARWGEACYAMLVPQVANGGACAESLECAAGYCRFTTNPCLGTCTAFVARGGRCNGDESCGPGNACVLAGVARACSPRPEPGTTGAGCVQDAECAVGLFCAGTCTPRLSEGASCATGKCEEGLTCSTADAGRRCVRVTGAGEDCAAAACGAFLYCAAATRRCAPDPVAGESCAEVGWCLDGSTCVGAAEPTCAFGTAPLGAPCDTAVGPTTTPATLCRPRSDARRRLECVPELGGARCRETTAQACL